MLFDKGSVTDIPHPISCDVGPCSKSMVIANDMASASMHKKGNGLSQFESRLNASLLINLTEARSGKGVDRVTQYSA